MWRVVIAATVAWACCATMAATEFTRGLDHFYNLEYEEAIREFRAEVASKPNEPEGYYRLAMAILYRELFRTGALETELVSGGNPFLRRPKMNPSPADEKEFFDAIGKAMELAREQLKRNPKDTRALYALGVAHGLRANYNFLVRKAYMDSLRDVTTSRRLHSRVVALDPSNYDARLVEGVHDYVVGSLPWHIRMLGFLAGFRGDKREGIRTLEEVARKGRLNAVDAEIVLCAIYRRERAPEKAVPLLLSLIQRFPRNFLLRLELAQMYSDLGKKEEALSVLDEMERLKASGARGYEKLSWEKLWYTRGVIQFWYRELEAAISNLERATRRTEQLDLNSASFAWLRLGQAYDLSGQRAEAVRCYRQVLALAPQSEAAREARQYIDRPYRRPATG